MPKLTIPERRPTKKLTLPSSTKEDPAWVEVYTEALSGDFEELANVGNKVGTSIVTGIVNIIKDWNFEDEDGKKAEINIHTVRRLKDTDLIFISKEVKAYDALAAVTEIEKKN